MRLFLYTPKSGSKLTTAPQGFDCPTGVQVVTWGNGSHHIAWSTGIARLEIHAEGVARTQIREVLRDLRYIDADGDEVGVRYLHADERGRHHLWVYSCQAPAIWEAIRRRCRFGVRGAEAPALLAVEQGCDDPHRWSRSILLPSGEERWEAPSMEGVSFVPPALEAPQEPAPRYGEAIPAEVWGDWTPDQLHMALAVWADAACLSAHAIARHVRVADWGDGCSALEYLAVGVAEKEEEDV